MQLTHLNYLGRLRCEIAAWVSFLPGSQGLYNMIAGIQEHRLQRIKKSLMHTMHDAPW